MVLKFIDESQTRYLKTLFYGIDGTGKSTAAKIYCESRGLKAAVIDFDNTNYTGLPRLQWNWVTDKDTVTGVISIIKDIEKSPDFDTLIIDGVGTFNNLLLPKGNESKRTYLVRTQNFKKIWKVLLHARINVIFIGQKDIIVTEDNDSSKFAEMINNMVDYKFHCIHSGKGWSADDFTYVCTKTREELEPLVGEPVIQDDVGYESEEDITVAELIRDNDTLKEEPKSDIEHRPAPDLINQCIDALTARGMSITTETVKVCLEGRFKNEDEYDECIEWLDNIGLGGFE